MLRTYRLELVFVGVVLATVCLLTSTKTIDWIAAAAVFASFGHAQISDRLAEREARKPNPEVECHWKARWYFVAKEALWCAFFVASGAYAALAGVVLFLAYPVWRSFYRRRRPLKTTNCGSPVDP